MSLKKRLLVTISMMALTVVMLMVGVWALKSTNFTVGGSIKFTAKGIQATISKGVLSETGSWKNASDAETKMPGFTITTNHSQSDVDTAMSEWKNLDLLFNENGDDVTIKFTITNNSGKDDQIIKVNVAVNDGTLNNATVGINTETAFIKSGDANKQEFVITFTVTEKTANASVTGFSLNFAMELVDCIPVDITNNHPYLTFETNDTTKKAIITAYDSTVTKDVVIPGKVSIGDKIYTVVIPEGYWNDDHDTIRGIFVRTGITSLVIEHGVEEIGFASFLENTSLKSIDIAGSVKEIGQEAFSTCMSLTDINFRNGIEKIGSSFVFCIALKSVVLPDSLKEIGNSAFSRCNTLESINIPDNVTSIGNSAFYGCSSLTGVSIPDGVTSIGNDAFSGCSKFTSITIPDGVTSIGDNLFYGCSSLINITIPDSIETIGDSAFHNCRNLTSITIPDSVTSIGSGAFSGCSVLTFSATENGANYLGNTKNPYVVLHSATSTSITSCTINSKCKFIYDSALSSCSSLESINIPDNVISIGGSAFQSCDGLTSVSIPDSVTSIGFSAFDDCSALTFSATENGANYLGNTKNPYVVLHSATSKEITSCAINSNCKFIYDKAFYGCTSLESINIPDSVKVIGSQAFYGCSSLATVIMEGATPPTLIINVFYNTSTSLVIYVPNETAKVAYQSATNWSDYSAKIVVGA